MNGKEHSGISLIIMILYGLFLGLINKTDLIWACVGVYLGGILPDILEPPLDYTHRQYFHSWEFLKRLGILLPITFVLSIFFQWMLFVFLIIIGYIAHLLADSTTKMGLPRVQRKGRWNK